MSAPGNGLLLSALAIVFIASTGYALGRIHQWYRASLERDLAYRQGYDTATTSLFSVAARLVRPRRIEKAAARGTAIVSPVPLGTRADHAAGGGGWAASARTVVDPDGRHKLLEELAHVPAQRA